MAKEAHVTSQSWSRRLQCEVDKDANYQNTYVIHPPSPPSRLPSSSAGSLLLVFAGFAGYWVIGGINTTAWTIGSSLLALGLSVGQAMGMVVCAAVIIAFLAVGAGWMGSHQHLGFTVVSRSSWGMRGAFWPVLNRVVVGCIWMGIQMFWGGQAVRIVLGALIGPKFVNMANTLPLSANVVTADLVCFFIFVIILAPTLWIRPEKLQLPFRVAFIMITSVMLGMLIWSLSTANGAGELISQPSTAQGSTLRWNSIFGLQSFLSAYVSGCLGQSGKLFPHHDFGLSHGFQDWTRYARTPNAALFGQAVTAPITICVTALCGILIASASTLIYGKVFWNPFLLLLHAQQSMTAASRAGTFFAGLGLLASQMALCIVLNSVPAGMDMTTVCPQYINIRRGAYIVMIVGIAMCPWNYVNQATTFITVISGWGIFLAPMAGILLADYFLVHRRELHLDDLYIGNHSSAYWYTAGFNWRAPVAWAMGVWPMLPGFARQVRGVSAYNGWDNIFRINFFVGLGIAFAVHAVLHAVFPAPGGRGSSPFGERRHGVLADRTNLEGDSS
ncbi:hypothetical protein EPUS_00384 [Endocarpon pusillum Z07020]|uniref:Uracil permease n=1 Tax=Endocarpon pusillum (strain Z07020 / HMAS-L-300199) TaxID=1263415 RepID=U1GEQ1_ENDPU|nr:uncharacterized protein EPUS_00384 [Endocarpon pusillum Z07020]ERF70196.1 hypothetical protein EPUS_00384 [Endocarpon pusillum Z07020]